MNRLDNYRIFYEVAKSGNITRASEKLFISQPAISQVIKKMEEQLGSKLFVRDKKGVTLTRFGERVFQKVETAMLSMLAVEKLAREEDELSGGDLVIGSGSTLAREILVEPLSKFLGLFPKIKVSQIEDVQEKMLDMLWRGDVDIVISQQNDNIQGLQFYSLVTQKYVFIKKKGGEVDRLIKMTKGSYTYECMCEFERKKGVSNLPDLTVTGYRMAIELAKVGLGLALVPEFLVRESLKAGELETIFKDYQLPEIKFGFYVNPLLLTRVTEVFIKFLDERF